MKKVLLKDKLVLLADEMTYGHRAFIEFMETERCIYSCDIFGIIYSMNKDTGQVNMMKPQKDKKDPYVNIGDKNYRIKKIMADLFFLNVEFDIESIGHLDGNPNNNAVRNLYIDLTPKPISKQVKREKKEKQ